MTRRRSVLEPAHRDRDPYVPLHWFAFSLALGVVVWAVIAGVAWIIWRAVS